MELEGLLDEIRREIEPCTFVLCFRLPTGEPLAVSSETLGEEGVAIASALSQVLEILEAADGGAGDAPARPDAAREVILESEGTTILLRVPAELERRAALALAVPADVGIGYARVAIDRHLPALVASLEEPV
ncbi:MAG: hypothetical protein ACFCGT_03185 [Sandaracinaceae bacterium]